MHKHTYTHTYIHTHSHTHTYIHTHTHSYIHTYITWIRKYVTQTNGCETINKYTNIYTKENILCISFHKRSLRSVIFS
jgi:hypothetical protein